MIKLKKGHANFLKEDIETMKEDISNLEDMIFSNDEEELQLGILKFLYLIRVMSADGMTDFLKNTPEIFMIASTMIEKEV